MSIVAVAKERARVTRFGTYTPDRTREFENQIRRYANKYAPKVLLASPLSLYLEFHLPFPKKPKFRYWPAVRPDVDNYLKAILDAFNEIIWKDDALVCDIRVIKKYALDSPKIVVKIDEL